MVAYVGTADSSIKIRHHLDNFQNYYVHVRMGVSSAIADVENAIFYIVKPTPPQCHLNRHDLAKVPRVLYKLPAKCNINCYFKTIRSYDLGLGLTYP